jgi:hypothetical protein
MATTERRNVPVAFLFRIRILEGRSCTWPRHEGILQEEERYSSTHPYPGNGMEVSGHLHALSASPPVMNLSTC